VISLEKYRVYELAKELNTTSKRLIEKLAEINITVKNHMSLLTEEEVEALYNHVGVIRRDSDKKADVEEKKSPPAVQPKTEPTKEAKNAPRIIRKTEIIIDTKNDAGDESDLKGNKKGFGKGQDRSGQKRHSIIRTADSNSGLRPGFVRDTRPVYQKGVVPVTKVEDKEDKKEERKETLKTLEKGLAKDAVKDTGKDTVKDTVKDTAKDTVKDAAKDTAKDAVKDAAKDAAKETIVKSSDDLTAKGPTKEPIQETINVQKKTEIKQEEKTVSHMEQTKADEVEPKATPIEEQKFSETVTQEPENKNKDEKAEQNMVTTKSKETEMSNAVADANRENKTSEKSANKVVGETGTEPRKETAPRNQGEQKTKEDFKNQNNKFHNNKAQGDRQKDGGRGQGDKQQKDDGQKTHHGNRQHAGFKGQNDNQRAGGFDKQGSKTGMNKNQGSQRAASKSLEIPKPDMSLVHDDEINSQRNESRREFQNKDIDKGAKREQRRELPKNQVAAGRTKKVKPIKVGLGDKNVSEILSDDFVLDDELYGDGVKKPKKPTKPKKENKTEKAADKVDKADAQKNVPHKAVLTSITIPESLTVKELAEALKKTATEVIKKLMSLGVMATLNQTIDFDTASIIADEFGVKAEKEVVVTDEDILFDDSEDDPKDLVPRPPVVVVMGHVDHGKTSLLDAIREANVTEREAGGITQHIGAYMVTVNNRNITFLDTPGHEAFTAMRARGAQVTDIAILVVAADDGVMPQTVEAINHAKAANVTIIVAINKIDKPGANPERVKQELTEYGLVPEEWGGDVIMVPVSAKQRTNIDQLLEMVLLTADILELKANPNRQAKGTVIEAKLDKNRGPIATMLVQRGTLKLGDSVVTGTTVGRIRAMVDDTGRRIKAAGPSTPVEVLGLPDVPEAGEIFYAIEDEKVAKHLAEKRKEELRERQLKATAKVSLDDLFNQIKEGKVKELNIIVKADVQGSVEALKQSLEKLSNDEVRIKIIHGAVGAINESDVTLAQVSNAIIIGFNVRPGANVAEAAENANVDIRLYRVIYDAIDDIKAAMKGMLEPTYKEVVQGHAEVRQIFKVSSVGTIAGCYVTDGKIVRNSEARLIRNGIVVYEGKLASLKRFKDDVREVAQGYECGMSLERFNDIKEGDIIESYVMEEIKR